MTPSVSQTDQGAVTPLQIQWSSSGVLFVNQRRLVATATINLIQTIVGAGILTLPAALLKGGVGIGIVNAAIMGIASALGFLAIGHVCQATGAWTYRDAWQQTIGRGAPAVDIVIFIETVFIMVGSMIIQIDYLGVFLGLLGISTTRVALAMVMVVPILLPLSLQPRLHNLRWSSTFGICALLYISCYVVTDSISHCSQVGSSYLTDATLLSNDMNGIFRATSVMARVYMAHYNAPDISAELSTHPKHWRSFVVTVIAGFGSTGLLYSVFALAGFARFGPTVSGNVLLHYEASGAIMLAWFSMLVTVVASFALHVKPARDGLAQALGIQLYTGPLDAEVVRVPFVTITLSILALELVFGILCTDLGFLLELSGALLAFPIAFVIPGFMMLRCPNTARLYRHGCGWPLAVFGIGNTLLGLYCTVSATY